MLLALDEVTRKNLVIVLAEQPYKVVVGLITKIESIKEGVAVDITDEDLNLVSAVCDEAPHKVAVAILTPLQKAIDEANKQPELDDVQEETVTSDASEEHN